MIYNISRRPQDDEWAALYDPGALRLRLPLPLPLYDPEALFELVPNACRPCVRWRVCVFFGGGLHSWPRFPTDVPGDVHANKAPCTGSPRRAAREGPIQSRAK